MFRNCSLFVMLIILLISIAGCGMCEDRETSGVPSPDNVVEFIIFSRDCGATTSRSILIYIVPIGEDIKDFHPVFRANRIDGLEVKWGRSKQLVIKYSEAQIFEFTNFWYSSKIDIPLYKVDIQELQEGNRGIEGNKGDGTL